MQSTSFAEIVSMSQKHNHINNSIVYVVGLKITL